MLERATNAALATEHWAIGRLVNSAILSASSPTQLQLRPRPLASRKQLRPLFWQHGAAAIELSSAWLSLARERLSDDRLASPPVAPFLYTREMADPAALGGSFKTGLTDLSIRTRPASLAPSGVRNITGSARLMVATPRMPLQRILQLSSLLAPDYALYREMNQGDPEIGNYDEGNPIPPFIVPASPDQRPHYLNIRMNAAAQINAIIDHEDFQYSDLVWKLFKQLSPLEVTDLRLPVLLFLARCSSPAELDRMQYLISSTPALEFNNEMTVVAVRLYIRLRNISKAFEYFCRGLTRVSSPQALEDLMIYAFWLRDWQLLSNLWQAWFNVRPDTPLLSEVGKIPKFHRHLLKFMEYLGYHGRTTQMEGFSETPEEPAKEPKEQTSGYIFRYQFHRHQAHPRFLDLIKQLAQNALAGDCEAWDAEPFLTVLNSAEQYEIYLKKAASQSNHVYYAQVLEFYRKAEFYRPSIQLLNDAFMIVCKTDNEPLAVGLYKDWIKYHSHLPPQVMVEYMHFFAYRGDSKAVITIWKQRLKQGVAAGEPKAAGAKAANDMAADEEEVNDTDESYEMRRMYQRYRLIAYAMQGNVKKARQQLDDIYRMSGEVGVDLWNALLVGFKRASDYRGAVKLFMELTTVVEPDSKTFANMMSIAATQGDLQYALELFGQAKEYKLEDSREILEMVLFSFCCTSNFTQARAVLEWTLESRMATTKMFNYLITALARDHRLTEMEGILQLMDKHSFKWDDFTFMGYMQAYVNTRMPEQAWKVYMRAVSRHQLIPRTRHFVTIMYGWNTSGQPWRTFEMAGMMRGFGLEQELDTLRLMVIAKKQWTEMYAKKPYMTQVPGDGGDPRELLDFYRGELAKREEAMNRGRAWHINSVLHAQIVAKILATLTTIHAWDLADEFLELYKKATGHGKLSPIVQRPVMWMHYNNREYDKVRDIWNRLYMSAIDSGRAFAAQVRRQVNDAGAFAAAPGPVAHQLPDPTADPSATVLTGSKWALDGPFTTMRFVLTQEGDTRGLYTLTNKLLDNGFMLSRRNWNHVVQVLAQRGMHVEAFDMCEKKLISTWAGWAPQRRRNGGPRALALDMRWAGRNRRTTFATSYTLVTLVNELNKLHEMEPWSSDAAVTLAHVRENCKNVMEALKTWRYSGSSIEKELFGENELVRELQAQRERSFKYETEDFVDLVSGRHGAGDGVGPGAAEDRARERAVMAEYEAAQRKNAENMKRHMEAKEAKKEVKEGGEAKTEVKGEGKTSDKKTRGDAKKSRPDDKP